MTNATVINIGLIGDRDDTVVAHRAIPQALLLAAKTCQIELAYEWLATESITSAATLESFDGLWCVPASPYQNMQGALLAIRYARERQLPFLGTCGGFQHAVLEFARSVLEQHDAEHAETATDADNLVITPLACALIEQTGDLQLIDGSRLQRAYGEVATHEGYHCSYGLNESFRGLLADHGLRVAAVDTAAEVRALELDGHPFYVLTLFQPERAALSGHTPPIVKALIEAIVAQRRDKSA